MPNKHAFSKSFRPGQNLCKSRWQICNSSISLRATAKPALAAGALGATAAPLLPPLTAIACREPRMASVWRP